MTSQSSSAFEKATFVRPPQTTTTRVGPLQNAVDAAYEGTQLEGDVRVEKGGVQTWTVPKAGRYFVEARGAMGGTGSRQGTGGRGAVARAVFSLAEGETVRILVGHAGKASGQGAGQFYEVGGGGGTFFASDFTTTASAGVQSVLHLAAGGGGGYGVGSSARLQERAHANTKPQGHAGHGRGGDAAGGAEGEGGSVTPQNRVSSGGAGWSGDGTAPTGTSLHGGGYAIAGKETGKGGDGGGSSQDGGYGGGGACVRSTEWGACGGGGGFSGGGAGYAASYADEAVGGGGGSYVGGRAVAGTVYVASGDEGNSGDGSVYIEFLSDDDATVGGQVAFDNEMIRDQQNVLTSAHDQLSDAAAISQRVNKERDVQRRAASAAALEATRAGDTDAARAYGRVVAALTHANEARNANAYVADALDSELERTRRLADRAQDQVHRAQRRQLGMQHATGTTHVAVQALLLGLFAATLILMPAALWRQGAVPAFVAIAAGAAVAVLFALALAVLFFWAERRRRGHFGQVYWPRGGRVSQAACAARRSDRGALDGKLRVMPRFAFSLCRLFGSYEGPQVRIRKSSDGTEADVYFDAQGRITRIHTVNRDFLGATNDVRKWAAGSSSVRAVVWYDQSGNASHAQGSAAFEKGENGTYSLRFAQHTRADEMRFGDEHTYANKAYFQHIVEERTAPVRGRGMLFGTDGPSKQGRAMHNGYRDARDVVYIDHYSEPRPFPRVDTSPGANVLGFLVTPTLGRCYAGVNYGNGEGRLMRADHGVPRIGGSYRSGDAYEGRVFQALVWVDSVPEHQEVLRLQEWGVERVQV